jgi:hypothetical protein
MSNPILAYHFVGSTLRDGRAVPPDGEWLIHGGPVKMCESGLHASRHPFDALGYAPGETLCRVECADIVQEHSDKLVCRRRRIVARIDATDLCRAFARACALDVVHLWNAPDVVRQYLETGDETIRAAAMDAAMAAWDFAMAVRWAASWDAARDARASWDAARAAMAARTAMAAARDASAAARDSARAASWDAERDARAAARAAQRARFAEMVEAAFAEVSHE